MAEPRIFLDLSRLLSRAGRRAPTGVDRVEMTYARRLQDHLNGPLGFAARHPLGPIGVLDDAAASAFLERTDALWNGRSANVSAAAELARLRPHSRRRPAPSVLVQASPNNLHSAQRIRRYKAHLNARHMVLVHDLIPVTHPEYARPDGAAQHRQRLETVRTEADRVLTVSKATAAALDRHWNDRSHPPVTPAPLGIAAPRAAVAPERRDRPYFLCVGTIEARKNHLLLLNIWRKLTETLPRGRVPELVLVGRRGWENEQVLDMLERSPGIVGAVSELGPVSETRLQALYAGAAALLMPSFAEGFGLPVGEALIRGCAVIASNLPAHREVGGMVPDYLDPLDGAGWERAILDHMSKGPMHQSQMHRLSQWQAPSWAAHLDKVAATAETLLGAKGVCA